MDKKMNFDDIIERIGSIGKYQIIQIVLLCIPHVNCAMFMVISVILLGVPDHRCKVPGYDDDIYAIQSPEHQTLVANFIPRSSDSTKDYDQCHVYTDNITGGHNSTFTGNRSTVECDSWVYSQSVFTETFVSKCYLTEACHHRHRPHYTDNGQTSRLTRFMLSYMYSVVCLGMGTKISYNPPLQHDLVCSNGDLLSLTKMMFFVGVLVGSFSFGLLADRYGRKFSMCCSLVLQFGSSVGLAWAPNLPVYIALRFLVGASTTGIVLTTFVLSLEIVGPSKRVRAVMVNGFFFAGGEVMLAGLGYWLRDWKYVELVVGGSTILFLPYFWIIQESPRWLLNLGSTKKAEKLIKRIAEVNKKSQHVPPLTSYKEDEKPKGDIRHLFTSKVLLSRTLILFLNWSVIAMTFYGLSMNAGNIGGDFYLNFMLLGVMDFPSSLILLIFLNRIGRKRVHCTAMIVGGVSCLSTLFSTTYGGESLHSLTVALVLIGKLGAGCAFGSAYVLTSELYPTVVRNAGMGACSCFARFGSMVAPYVISSAADIGGAIGKAVPLIIFGSASIAAGLSALLLPETLNKDLPDTIEQGKQFGISGSESKKKVEIINNGFSMDEH